jgi:hypothetical protein
MVSVFKIISGITEPNREYQNCNTSEVFIFGGYVKVREALYTQVIIWGNSILNHIGTRAILPGYEGSCMVSRLEWHQNKNTGKYTYPTGT